jgi:hypothetical protein
MTANVITMEVETVLQRDSRRKSALRPPSPCECRAYQRPAKGPSPPPLEQEAPQYPPDRRSFSEIGPVVGLVNEARPVSSLMVISPPTSPASGPWFGVNT